MMTNHMREVKHVFPHLCFQRLETTLETEMSMARILLYAVQWCADVEIHTHIYIIIMIIINDNNDNKHNHNIDT